MSLVLYILGKILAMVCHCFPPRLDVLSPGASTSAMTREILAAKGGIVEENGVSVHGVRDLLHAANLRHGTALLPFRRKLC